MDIIKSQNGSELTVTLNGRLDTSTAPELEEALVNSLEGIEKLILDFENLAYLSSAGLRVLLTLQKRMSKQGIMKITRVNDTIAEVFEITGFSDILTIV